MKHIAPLRRQRKSFDFAAKRRREIVLHARHIGASETEDFSRWLTAWHWYNPKASDPIWSLMEAAKRMGGRITEADASAITEEASITRKCWSADNLARFLGVTYADRQALGLTTIGSVNVKKRARKELRKVRAKKALERKRREIGVISRAEYEAKSLSKTQPWRELGMSRRSWYRKNKARIGTGTSVSTPIFLISDDRPVPTGLEEREFEGPKAPKEVRELTSSQTASTMAVEIHASLPLELRLLALGLDMRENWREAA